MPEGGSMNSRIVIAFWISFLMVTGLNAQEIETTPAEGRALQGDLVAPEASMLVLHVPVSLQFLSDNVWGAYVTCEVQVRATGDDGVFSIYGSRALPLTAGAYGGVVTLRWEYRRYDNLLPAELLYYACTLLLCANSVSNPDNPEGVPPRCNRPSIEIEGDGDLEVRSPGSSSPDIRPDPDVPYNFVAQDSFQED